MPNFTPSDTLVDVLQDLYLKAEPSDQAAAESAFFRDMAPEDQRDICRENIAATLREVMSDFYCRMQSMLQQHDVSFCLSEENAEGNSFERGMIIEIIRRLLGVHVRQTLDLTIHPHFPEMNDLIGGLYNEYLQYCRAEERSNTVHENVEVDPQQRLIMTVPAPLPPVRFDDLTFISVEGVAIPANLADIPDDEEGSGK